MKTPKKQQIPVSPKKPRPYLPFGSAYLILALEAMMRMEER